MKYGIRQVLCSGLALVMTALLSCPAFAAKQPQRVVRVAFPQQADLTEIREDGSYNGYTYDYLEKIAQLTGWKMEYVLIDEPTLDESIQKALDMLIAGEVDLFGSMRKSPQLESYFEFTQNSYGIMDSVLAAREDDASLNSSNFVAKQPLSVGVWKNATQTQKNLPIFWKVME